ncbi:sensor histidine kinase [Brucella anthropi]|uniref:sensor histidine kinase n=1 Tax=Brucella anthropi TaxID=529 RepID=UPI00384E03B8
MVRSIFRRKIAGGLLRIILVAGLMTAIFIVDTVTQYAVAAAVFYTVVILLSARLLTGRALIALATICVVLTVVSFLLTSSGAYREGLVNTGISIIAIASTTYLGLKLVSAEIDVRESRERLLRMARATTLGQLTSSISHEVSQPLVAIETSASAGRRWLSQFPPNVERAAAAFERISEDSHRASEILDRVRRLSRGEKPRSVAFDINLAVREIIELAQPELDRHAIALDLDLAPELPRAFADRVQIQQVVGNLVLNAIEAMQRTRVPARSLTVSTSLSAEKRVKVVARDNGPGIAAADRERLFDAFWTTKEGGFGLGLTICRTIVEANGGSIFLGWSSAGTTIVFEIPIARETRA